MRQTTACIQILALLIDLIYNSIIDGTGHTLSCTFPKCTFPNAHFQMHISKIKSCQQMLDKRLVAENHLLCSYIAAATVLQDRVGQHGHLGWAQAVASLAQNLGSKLRSRHV